MSVSLQPWVRRQSTTQPPARHNAAIAFDPITESVVMYGGTGAPGMFGDTWSWRAGNWQRLAPAGPTPAPRISAALSEDPGHRHLVLFGGTSATGDVLSDTWLWTGDTWDRQTPRDSPKGRAAPSIAPDLANQSLLLFGGEAGERVAQFLDDTWLWKRDNWTRVGSVGPSARSGATLAAVRSRRKTYLFGGGNGEFLNDLWSWDGKVWSRESRTTQSPTARQGALSAYIDETDDVILFGGLVERHRERTN